MSLPQAILLSVIEGITEFLPVSSTGHLILAQHMLGIAESPMVASFTIIIQAGAIAAVGVLYAQTIIKHPKVIMPVLIAFIPTGIIGFFLYRTIKHVFLTTDVITVVALIAGGFVLMWFERFIDPPKTASLTDIQPKQALIIGIAQSISVIPGVSRAGATIVGSMAVGLRRTDAVRFSFLLAVPTIVAASVLDIAKSAHLFSQSDIYLIIIGTIFSCLSAIVAMRMFLSYLRNNSLQIFGVYRIVIGIVYALVYLR